MVSDNSTKTINNYIHQNVAKEIYEKIVNESNKKWIGFFKEKIIQHLDDYIHSGLLDIHYIKEAKTNFDKFCSRLFEAMIYSFLQKMNSTTNNAIHSCDKGPDFILSNNNKNIFIEAICPLPKNNPSMKPLKTNPSIYAYNENSIIPTDHIMEAWTGAFNSKSNHMKPCYQNNNDTPCIIAISPLRFESWSDNFTSGSNEELPYPVKALFGLNKSYIDGHSGKVIVVPQSKFRKNSNGNATIECGYFFPKSQFSEAHNHISAVLLQDIRRGLHKEEYSLVHNYNAINPISRALFKNTKNIFPVIENGKFSLRDDNNTKLCLD